MRSMFIVVFLVTSLAFQATVHAQSDNLEITVCGSVKEPFYFWLWSRAAGKVNPQLAQQVKNAQSITYKTSDGRVLQGYKVNHTAEDGTPRGSVLLAQGNAMLADQLLRTAANLGETGLDVYVFDYRGYGHSEGKPRLKAIVSDYKELFRNVIPQNSGKRHLYGISFGGVIVSNVIGSGVEYDRAVIDSSPSRLSNHGCEEKYDPVVNIPRDASKILVIAGELDTIVKPSDSLELRNGVEDRGGKVVLRSDFAHPFLDLSMEIHMARIALIKQHLLDSASKSITANNVQLRP